jgi:hypothetical protein
MSLTPEQLNACTELFCTLDSIARRLIREGKARIENGKIIFIDEVQKES